MLPTAYAEALWPLVRQILMSAEQLVEASNIFDPSVSQRRFRISASDFIMAVIVTPLLRRLEKMAPQIGVDVIPTGAPSMSAFESGDIDLVITPEQYLSPYHPSEPLFEDEHVVIGCSHNEALQAPIDIDRFFELGHIAVSVGVGRELSVAERALLSYRDRRRIEVSAPTFSGVLWMLPGTQRVAVLQKRLALAFENALPLKFQPLPIELPRLKERVQYHSSRANDIGIAWLVNEIKLVAERSSGDY